MSHRDILEASWFTPGMNGRWGLPLILWGDPGIAKLKVIERTAAECGLLFNATIAAIGEPADIAGYPRMGEEYVEHLPAKWAYVVNKAVRSVQCFDEMTSCGQAVQAALMRVVLDGKAGEIDLDKHVRFTGAANPPESAANGNDLAISMANRFAHLQWNPGGWQEYADYITSDLDQEPVFGDAKAMEERVMKVWWSAFAKAKGLALSYLKRNTGELHMLPDPNSPQASGAWPSRRTWECTMRALAGADIHGLNAKDRSDWICAYIGQGPGGGLMAFEREQDLPDPEALADGKVEFTHNPDRLDRTIAVLQSLAAYITPQVDKSDKKLVAQRIKRGDNYWKITTDITKSAEDLVVPSAKKFVQAGLDSKVCPASKPVLLKISSMVERALGRGRRNR